ncbi:tRNA(Met) cytidine acetate ligase [Breznakia blatticola]|nr:nucleotidyltransferase family protein [Breznakia blatticola]
MRKLTVCGIVCEYNPFHNGHIHHIQQAKVISKCDVLVCIMSGNFVQRGEPAIIDKWERTKIALDYGVDIVVELPYIYATQSANHFAKASIDILKMMQVDCIVFGSESNDVSFLHSLVAKEKQLIKKPGQSSAKAYEEMFGDLSPNDILGYNYIKAIGDAPIAAYTIQRTNAYHGKQLTGSVSSATSIRNQIANQQVVSNTTPMTNLDDRFLMEHYFPFIKYQLQVLSKQELAAIFLMDEGMESHLYKQVELAVSYDDFIKRAITKRYTKASIQRSLIHLLTHTTKQVVNSLPALDYVRILGFNQTGQNYLANIKEDIHLASSFGQIPQVYRDMEYKAAQVYASVLPLDKQAAFIKKEIQQPIIKKDSVF